MARQIKFGDKLLLQGETLVLDNGTSAGVIRSKNGTVQIEGNLIVTGDTTTVNSTQTSFADPKILLNGDLSGSPTEDVGIEIGRGSSANKFLTWNETSDKWTVGSESFVAGTFEGNITGAHNGTVGATTPAAGTFTTVDINAGTIDGTVIGASSPQAGTFTTLSGTVTGTVSSIANHSTTDLSEGTNLYYTDARVDSRYATLHANADADTLDGQNGTYYLDYTNFTGTPTTTSSLANHSIDALNDVDTTTVVPTNNQTIVWNASSSKFLPGDSFSQSDFDSAFTAKDTDALSEGTTNLYYSDARARAVSIENIVEDVSPQLGGNLDLNTFDLSTTDPTLKLTTTTTPITTQGTVVASTDTNLSNAVVTVNTDGADIANAVSSYVTLTSTQIASLGFKGDISLTYFGAAASSSNFKWRDVSENTEQNNMVIVYAPPSDAYTFTLPTSSMGSETAPINSLDADIYYKQYAYGQMTVTSASVLSGSNIQLRDNQGFYIDKAHVKVIAMGGTSYKIVFWTHDVSVGDVIDVIAASAQTALFEWGTSSFAETGITLTAESFSLQSSTNDIFAMGDLNFTLGLTTGEVVGTFIYDDPTGSSILSGLTTVTIDGTSYLSTQTITDVPIILTGNASKSTELSIAVGSYSDARLWLLDGSGNLIYKFPAADGSANQVMKTNGSGDVSWTSLDTDAIPEGSTNLYYTAARDTAQFNTDLATKSTTNLAEGTNLYYTDARWNTKMTAASTSDLSEGTNLYYTNARADARAQLKIDALVDSAPAALDTLNELAAALGDDANHVTTMTNLVSGNTTLINNLTHDGLTGFVADEHIDWTTDQGSTEIHANNYSNTGDTTYTAGTGISIDASNVISNTASAVNITGNIIPATDNTYTLGTSSKKYSNIFGHTVTATYADLAERYATDVPYEAGTVVVFGGEAEITTTIEPGDVSVAGVISTNPALKLNADAGNSQTHPYVALKGRVPCLLIGPVSKGDLIVTADNEPGFAQSIGKNDAGHSVFAKSIETDLTEGKKLIEVVIL